MALAIYKMKSIDYAKRLLYGVVVVTILAVSIGPWGLYWLGLFGVDGKPKSASIVTTENEKNAVWLQAKGIAGTEIEPISPHGYIYQLYAVKLNNPGLRVSWQVATNHLIANKKYKGSGWWHLSGAALTIWITRNWTTEQTVTKAVEIKRAKMANN